MILEATRSIKISASIDETSMRNMKKYIQGAVYCWCKNCKSNEDIPKWFSASDLFGGDNFYWEGTPLHDLYSYHFDNGASNPIKMAGKDVGHLLRDVLVEDKRHFNTRQGYTREYKWNGQIEDNN